MTKQERNQQSAHWKIQRDRAIKMIKEVDEQYITENAPHPIGTTLQIDDIGKERIVVVKSYDIDETGHLTPVYVTQAGKHVFNYKPIVLKMLKEPTK